LPVLGRCDIDGLFIATGHFRNGILLAPITAELMAKMMVTGEEPEEIRPFSAERF
jgi:glycine oxidase